MATDRNDQKQKRPLGHRPKWPKTETATNEMATDRDGHKHKRPETETQTETENQNRERSRNDQSPKWLQTKKATNQKDHRPERPLSKTAIDRNDQKPTLTQTETYKYRVLACVNVVLTKPKRPNTEMATNQKGHKPKCNINTSKNTILILSLILSGVGSICIFFTDRNDHKPKRPQRETTTDQNGHKQKRPQTGTATKQNGLGPKRQEPKRAKNEKAKKPKRPQTKTAIDRNGHRPEWQQT